jgi:hypothetical protein
MTWQLGRRDLRDGGGGRMTPVEFDKYTDELIANVRSTDGVRGLILVGSTTSERASARDRWSDHDFYAVLSEGEEQRLREQLPFLPFRNDVATIAHDGDIGVSVLYRDGHLLEFAAATAAELNQFRLGHHEIVYGAEDIHLLVASAVQRGRVEKPLVAADQVSLALIKLMIGVGRARRGELVNGGSFVRTYAIGHLAAAVLARIPYEIAPTRDGLDPERRFEECYPSISRPLGMALDQPLEQAARSVHKIARATLEPGWADFPSAAADLVADQLGWVS